MNKMEKLEKLISIRKQFKIDKQPYYIIKKDNGFFPLSDDVKKKIRQIQLDNIAKHKKPANVRKEIL